MYKVDYIPDWEFDENAVCAHYKSDDYSIDVELNYDRLGYEYIEVSCDDNNRNYTHGSYTTASIPTTVIDELRRKLLMSLMNS